MTRCAENPFTTCELGPGGWGTVQLWGPIWLHAGVPACALRLWEVLPHCPLCPTPRPPPGCTPQHILPLTSESPAGEPSTFPSRSCSLWRSLPRAPGGAQPLLFPNPHPSPSQGSLGPRGQGCGHGCRRPPGPTAECREDKWLPGEGQHVRTTSHYYCVYTRMVREFSSRSGRSTVPGIRVVQQGEGGTRLRRDRSGVRPRSWQWQMHPASCHRGRAGPQSLLAGGVLWDSGALSALCHGPLSR